MHLAEFDFDLPRELIADRPAEPRDSARLLVLPAEGAVADRRIADLPRLLRPGDLLVFNGTQAIPARLVGRRGLAAGEITLARDRGGIQPICGREEGAVAAPSAGLHCPPALFDALAARGVEWVTVTLHVGPGTFLPVKADDPREHRMHAEWGVGSAEATRRINDARARGDRIVAVGTTSLRLLESAASESG